MDDNKHERRLAFLEALTKLSHEHGFSISACGCCCGPNVWEVDPVKEAEYTYRATDTGDYLEFKHPEEK